MGKSKVRPPSKVDALSVPVFGLTWYGSPCILGSGGGGSTGGKINGCSVVAYSGGGGSAKTGINNKIIVDVDSDALFATKRYEISTGDQLCFGVHAYRPHDDRWNMVRLLAAVGDELRLYGVPLGDDDDDDDSEGGDDSAGDSAADDGGATKKKGADVGDSKGVVLLGNVNVGKSYGCNAMCYTPLHHGVAVGCENGTIVLYRVVDEQADRPSEEGGASQFNKVAECQGHTKAVCAVAFHPRGTHILSGAKDGTARVWNAEDGSEAATLKCSVDDPDKPPPKPAPVAPTTGPGGRKIDPRMIKRAPQILVRGCMFGDLEGKVVYTVASGKRGAAYLTKWKAQPVPMRQQPPPNMGPGGGVGPGGPPGAVGGSAISFREEFRIKCSPVPISATSLSGDASILAMGSVEGSINLYDLENRKVVKSFDTVHDLPVTCIAARPISRSLPLPQEEEEGVSFDAISASVDNRLGRWTLQKKSLKKVPPAARLSSQSCGIVGLFGSVVRLPVLLLVGLVAMAARDSYELCGDRVWGPALFREVDVAKNCIWKEVLWADSTRPGVSGVPV